ncbi:MAG: restriction endonuclease subunit M [Aciduliprofundum sp.]|nr:MAG: restriction endonuclease subunit M [Aciduliprofundum sp.]
MDKKQATLYGEIDEEEQEGEVYIKDYITGKVLKDTPEERRRQEIEKRLVEEWGYPKELIGIEVEIQFGSQKLGRADIVVFNDAKSRDPNRNAYIIVEVKKESRKDGIEQLESYINATTTEFGIWYNGRDIAFIRRLREPNQFQDISRIPRYGESFEDLNRQLTKKDLKPAYNLKVRFDEIYNYLYANEGFLKEKLFGEIIKLIFMKIVDEKSPREEVQFWISESEYEEMLGKGTSTSFKQRIQRLWEDTKNFYPDIDGDLLLKLLSIAEIVRRLQEISFMKTKDDIKGTAFQTFIHENMRGDRGEFFTPQPAIELAVGMLDPQYNESVIDPACGTGRFLIWTMEHVKKKFKLDARGVADYARARIAGIDINPDLVKVAKMYMVLYEDGWSNIFSVNSLLPFDEMEEVAEKIRVSKPATPEPGKFDIVLTNLPFGTKGKIKDQRILVQFDLAHKWMYDKKQRKWIKTTQLLREQTPEILFIERCWQLLKPYGRMAIVLPDGILTNSTLGYVRQWIMDHARILASVSLPQETFVPYGIGTKASVLVVQKLPEDELERLKKYEYPIFMAVAEKIGYDVRGRTIFKRDEEGNIIKDEKGEPIVDTDIPEIIRKFDEFRKKYSLNF